MTRNDYYESLKILARKRRELYGISGPRALKSDFKRIFKAEGIRLDYWRGPLKKLRGAYFNDDFGPSIMVANHLPQEPFVFTLAHEYKHHLTDQDESVVHCISAESKAIIEIGAEVFAAEFIYPEALFLSDMQARSVGPGQCTAKILVRFKHETKTTLSYAALRKRAIRLGFGDESLPTAGWRRLEEEMGFGFRRFIRP